MAGDPFAETTEQFERVLAQQSRIKRKALAAVNQVVKPKLEAATPIRVSAKQGGNSLAPGLLREAIQSVVHIGKGDEDHSYAEVNFGPLDHIARFVDTGHKPPHGRTLGRRGVKDTRESVPAHPFVRKVQDATEAEAQQAFESVMEAETQRVFDGK